ncbi:MAG: hypothetical protein M0P01_13435 [Treponema sp.]|nr:hypothetical protein [Treponema sp.]
MGFLKRKFRNGKEKAFNEGMKGGVRLSEDVVKKNTKAVEYLKEQADRLSPELEKIKQVILQLSGVLEDIQIKELYGVVKTFDYKSGLEPEEKILILKLFSYIANNYGASKTQMQYANRLCSFLCVNPNDTLCTGFDGSAIANIDSRNVVKALFLLLKEYLFLEKETHNYGSKFEEVLGWFGKDVNASDAEALINIKVKTFGVDFLYKQFGEELEIGTNENQHHGKKEQMVIENPIRITESTEWSYKEINVREKIIVAAELTVTDCLILFDSEDLLKCFILEKGGSIKMNATELTEDSSCHAVLFTAEENSRENSFDFNSCTFRFCNDAFKKLASGSKLSFTNCKIKDSRIFIDSDSAELVLFEGCTIENCRDNFFHVNRKVVIKSSHFKGFVDERQGDFNSFKSLRGYHYCSYYSSIDNYTAFLQASDLQVINSDFTGDRGTSYNRLLLAADDLKVESSGKGHSEFKDYKNAEKETDAYMIYSGSTEIIATIFTNTSGIFTRTNHAVIKSSKFISCVGIVHRAYESAFEIDDCTFENCQCTPQKVLFTRYGGETGPSFIFAASPDSATYTGSCHIRSCLFKSCVSSGSLVNFSNTQKKSNNRCYCTIEDNIFIGCKCSCKDIFVSKCRIESFWGTSITNGITDRNNNINNQGVCKGKKTKNQTLS